MKHLTLFNLLLLVMFTNKLSAQESKTDKIFKTYRFGLFVGPTFNWLKPTASSSEAYAITKGKGRVGFNFGISADYNVNDRYTIYTGLGMDWRGGGITAIHDSSALVGTDSLRSADILYKKMQYLTIPVGLKMMAFESGKIKVFAQTGLDLGILLSQKGDYTLKLADNTIVSKTKEKLGGTATVVPITMGWCIGAGFEYSFNDKNSGFVSLLYRNGFIDATSPNSNDKTRIYSDGNIRSNAIVIRFGYFF